MLLISVIVLIDTLRTLDDLIRIGENVAYGRQCLGSRNVVELLLHAIADNPHPRRTDRPDQTPREARLHSYAVRGIRIENKIY